MIFQKHLAMNRNLILSFFSVCVWLNMSLAQEPVKKLDWNALESIEFKKRFVKSYDAYAMFPIFSAAVKNLDGKMVEIAGFTIPLEPSTKWVALSMNPNASCFFCGAAGPASVMTIRFKKGRKEYNIDDYKRFRGRLKLNGSDINEFYYILEDAEEIDR